MKKILLIILIIGFAKTNNAQTPNWGWAETQTGGTCYTQAQQLAIGPTGKDIYLSGRFAGTITLNGGLSATSNATQVFSAKIDSSGKFIWFSPHTASGGIDYSYGFGIDYKDNTYSTGQIGGSFFIDKFDSNGIQKWYHPGGNAAGYDIKTDDTGNVYITGEFSGSFTIGGITLNSISGSTDMFLAKLDSNGNGKWAVSGGGTGYDGGRELALDPAGNIYVCGSYSANGTFGTVSAPTVVSGYPNLFIAKYNSSGTALRVSTATNAGFDNSYEFWRWEVMTVDSCGNAYVSGNFINTAQFGSLSVTSLANSGSDFHNLYVAKCHFDGTWEWVQGALGTGDDQTIGIAIDKADDVYITGDIEGTVQFGTGISATATSASGSAFLAKYNNSTGDAQWAQVSGGTGNWALEGIDIDKNGYVYCDGNGGNGTGIFGTATVTDQASCGQNILITKMDTIPPRAIIPILSKSYCPGSTDTIPYSLIGSFNLGNIFTAEISDSIGSFISYDTLGSLTSNTNGKIVITIPDTIKSGSTYLIRIVSSSPATSSYAACTGDYITNVYNNSFYITIGGGSLNVQLLPSDSVAICSGSQVQLSASGGSSYTWNNGDTSSSITVNPLADTTFNVVVSNGGCILDTSIKVTVNSVLPLTVLPPSSQASTCAGVGITLSVTAPGKDYEWIPAATLKPDTGITVVATPYLTTTYTVSGINSSGCSVIGYDTVSVKTGFNKPVIADINNLLTTTATEGNQWYRNSSEISGATSESYLVTDTGCYWEIATNIANGCSSVSDTICITPSGIKQLSINSNQISIYPNPTNGEITLNISSSVGEVKDWYLQITDVLGRTVYTKLSLNYSNDIDLSGLPGGVYLITVINKSARAVVPVVKQ